MKRTICGKAHIWPKIGVKSNFIIKVIIFNPHDASNLHTCLMRFCVLSSMSGEPAT